MGLLTGTMHHSRVESTSFETRQRNGCLHFYTCYRLSVLGKQSHVGCIVKLLKENKDFITCMMVALPQNCGMWISTLLKSCLGGW